MSILVRLVFGMSIEDTQTGLRGIPSAFACELTGVPGNGYEFEANMLLEARNRSIEVLQVPIDTVYENDNASSHFRPFMDSLRICSVFIRYALSSCASSIVDLACFALFNLLLDLAGLGLEAVVLATYGARLVSALFNFAVNKRLVFKREHASRSALRYAILCIACVSVSAALVAAASWLFPFIPAVVAKIVVDTVLFFANYRIQESWVFRGKRSATVS